MKVEADVWYIGFICKHCNRLQAIMPDPTRGALGFKGSGGKLKTKCEDCDGYGEYDLGRHRWSGRPEDPPESR